MAEHDHSVSWSAGLYEFFFSASCYLLPRDAVLGFRDQVWECAGNDTLRVSSLKRGYDVSPARWYCRVEGCAVLIAVDLPHSHYYLRTAHLSCPSPLRSRQCVPLLPALLLCVPQVPALFLVNVDDIYPGDRGWRMDKLDVGLDEARIMGESAEAVLEPIRKSLAEDNRPADWLCFVNLCNALGDPPQRLEGGSVDEEGAPVADLAGLSSSSF